MKKLLPLLILLGSCEFRMSDEDASEELRDVAHIQFGDLMVKERNMHYAFIDANKSILLVFVHGSPGSWNAFIDYFAMDTLRNDFDMLSVDRAGFGLSGFGEAEPSMEIQANQVKEVLDLFPDKKKILIGHSLGGPVIARMAMDYPTAFDGLILLAPSVDPAMEKDEWYRGAIDTKVGAFFTPKEFEVSNDEILPLKEELKLMLPLWEKIRVPTVVIQGTKDRLVPKENADFVASMLPDSLVEIVMLEGANHFIPWSHDKEIRKAIYQLTDSL